MKKTDPIRPTNDEARLLARTLITEAKFGSLGVIDPETRGPMVTRAAVGTDPSGTPISLVSSLSHHTRALRENPVASLLLGEPASKGDPLTHPRVTLMGRVGFIEHSDSTYEILAVHYLRDHPKAKLYIGFGDFVFVRFDVQTAYLNGGFGKAFVLSPDDLS